MKYLKYAKHVILGVLVVVGLVAGVAFLSTLADPTALAEQAASEDKGNPPGHAEAIDGRDVSRVTLTADAVRRLGLKTATVQAAQSGEQQRLRIPYAAVLYDSDGVVWAFTNPEPLVYVREKIVVETVQGDVATLSEGPPAGTAVVTVGAAELYGTEVGVGEG